MAIQRHNPAYRLTQNMNEKAFCHAGLHSVFLQVHAAEGFFISQDFNI
jgi:hypothetical protein